MLITFQEDGVLRVYASVEEAVRDVEALDVEEVFRTVFNESAQPFVIHWIRPNKLGRVFFGLFGLAKNGEYTLVPSGAADPQGLLRTFRSTQAVEPASLAPNVRELELRLATGSC